MVALRTESYKGRYEIDGADKMVSSDHSSPRDPPRLRLSQASLLLRPVITERSPAVVVRSYVFSSIAVSLCRQPLEPYEHRGAIRPLSCLLLFLAYEGVSN